MITKSFSTRILGRNINPINNNNIFNKEDAFACILKSLRNFSKPITAEKLLKIGELATNNANYNDIDLKCISNPEDNNRPRISQDYKSDSENEIDNLNLDSDVEGKVATPEDKLSKTAFQCLIQLAKNESSLFSQNVTRGFSKFLVLAFIIDVHDEAFNDRRTLDCAKFKTWLEEKTNIFGNQIPDKYIEGVHQDHLGYIKFGRKNYSKCDIHITDKFLGIHNLNQTQTLRYRDYKYKGTFSGEEPYGPGTLSYKMGANTYKHEGVFYKSEEGHRIFAVRNDNYDLHYEFNITYNPPWYARGLALPEYYYTEQEHYLMTCPKGWIWKTIPNKYVRYRTPPLYALQPIK